MIEIASLVCEGVSQVTTWLDSGSASEKRRRLFCVVCRVTTVKCSVSRWQQTQEIIYTILQLNIIMNPPILQCNRTWLNVFCSLKFARTAWYLVRTGKIFQNNLAVRSSIFIQWTKSDTHKLCFLIAYPKKKISLTTLLQYFYFVHSDLRLR